MSIHTPGPWEYDGKFTVTITDAEGSASFRTRPANARLIAAAPELLDVVRKLLRVVEVNGLDPVDAEYRSISEQAEIAVAKAEGRS